MLKGYPPTRVFFLKSAEQTENKRVVVLRRAQFRRSEQPLEKKEVRDAMCNWKKLPGSVEIPSGQALKAEKQIPDPATI
jgi:hypothetical protein